MHHRLLSRLIAAVKQPSNIFIHDKRDTPLGELARSLEAADGRRDRTMMRAR